MIWQTPTLAQVLKIKIDTQGIHQIIYGMQMSNSNKIQYYWRTKYNYKENVSVATS